jgi:hypothetical protein
MRLVSLFVTILFAGCLFPMSQADIERANAQHLQRLRNDQNYAYETGYNAGLKRSRLDTTWIDRSCAPEVQVRIREHYHAGYNIGVSNAPLVVPARSRTYVVAEHCTFSSDCGDGRTCRDRQCMGEGFIGDACWFSSDCLSGTCNYSEKVCT